MVFKTETKPNQTHGFSQNRTELGKSILHIPNINNSPWITEATLTITHWVRHFTHVRSHTHWSLNQLGTHQTDAKVSLFKELFLSSCSLLLTYIMHLSLLCKTNFLQVTFAVVKCRVSIRCERWQFITTVNDVKQCFNFNVILCRPLHIYALKLDVIDQLELYDALVHNG